MWTWGSYFPTCKNDPASGCPASGRSHPQTGFHSLAHTAFLLLSGDAAGHGPWGQSSRSSVCSASICAQFSLLQRWYFVISKPTPFLIKCLFCPYCRVIIQDYGKLGLFGCLWTEKELQSQLWTVCCEKQKLRCMLTELRTSERGDANLGGALSVSFWIGFVLWYKDPERNQREFKSAPYFSSESLAVTFLTYINTDHKDLLSLEEKKKHWRNLWSQKESNNINFSCQVTSFNYIHPYWTILSPPLLAFPIISVSWLGEIPLLPTGTSSVYWSRPTYLFRR